MKSEMHILRFYFVAKRAKRVRQFRMKQPLVLTKALFFKHQHLSVDTSVTDFVQSQNRTCHNDV